MAKQSGEADLMSLGDHCEVVDCRQIDFLPFKCDACQKVRFSPARKYYTLIATGCSKKSFQHVTCCMF